MEFKFRNKRGIVKKTASHAKLLVRASFETRVLVCDLLIMPYKL